VLAQLQQGPGPWLLGVVRKQEVVEVASDKVTPPLVS